MDQYTSDVFASLVGQVFCFHRTPDGNDPPSRLELLEVQALPHRSGFHSRQSFSLLFALRSGDAALQSTLHLRHDEFEPCAWFINRVTVPGRDPQTPYYEAVFG
jgi:hypothetical protein